MLDLTIELDPESNSLVEGVPLGSSTLPEFCLLAWDIAMARDSPGGAREIIVGFLLIGTEPALEECGAGHRGGTEGDAFTKSPPGAQ
ncbi:MAG: hypothetical protein ABIN58_12855 [candidate division WOR-3 bacterium]